MDWKFNTHHFYQLTLLEIVSSKVMMIFHILPFVYISLEIIYVYTCFFASLLVNCCSVITSNLFSFSLQGNSVI
jgi:hypothetical protein